MPAQAASALCTELASSVMINRMAAFWTQTPRRRRSREKETCETRTMGCVRWATTHAAMAAITTVPIAKSA
jgi:hypothetical protein